MSTVKQSFSNPASSAGWKAIFSLYLFFAYFSVLPQLILYVTDNTVFVGLRQAIVMSVLWFVPVFLLPRFSRTIVAAVGVLLWLTSLVSIAYFCIYGQEFSQSVIFTIFESNPAESREFIAQYFVWWMIPVFLAHTLVAWLLWRNVKPFVMPPEKAWLLSGLILAGLLVYPFLKYKFIDHDHADQVVEKLQLRFEPAVPWQLVIGYVQYREQLASMEALLRGNAQIPPLQNLQDKNAGLPATLVLVIGESTNRQHMSLYGYPRKTTPQLDAMKDELLVFKQVVGPRPYTIEALQQVLTFADQQHPDLYLTKPSIMNMMRQAGYKSFWITNQQTMTKRNTMLTTFSKYTDKQVYLNHTRLQNSRQYDGDVLAPFAEALQDPAPRKLIVLHLLGTHMKYKYRYPDEYIHFKDNANLAPGLDKNKVEVINAYDNAVLYNDFVVSNIIKTYKASRQHGFLVYFSDHGEDVYEAPGYSVLGRNESSPTLPMYAVPFLLWMTPDWRAKMPEISNDVLERPYSTSHFIHTWADLAGLQFTDYEPHKSLINPRFEALPLLVGNPNDPKSLKVLPKAK
ncbi:phosphoethanolamine transferase CptA [Methylotenera sp. G11]|uniref:phosphoethanolamine transferase CptA n=1 Tax=Methylotenera sp. G11 TaxID=1506585 RepID=UPI0006461ECB|nr:phosphoethanolamine transferase CptA [Methylotenera sp. G11]